MDAARRVVLVEGGMGALWIVLGVVNVGLAGLRDAWWVGALAFGATVAVTYADEHRLLVRDDWYRYAAAIVGVIASVIVVAVIVLVTDLVVLTVVSVALAGTGTGLLGYRIVYGVIRPLPETRRDAARERPA